MYVVAMFAIGASNPDEMAFLSTESLRNVHLSKADNGYGLELDWNTIVEVSACSVYNL